MADPLSYYRVLREHYPVYYLPQWDTFALSRFADIWDVLAVNDGTFVASEGTLPPASTLGHHNDGPVADPPWHPLPFHAVFDAPIYDGVRQAHSKPFRPKAAAQLETRIRELANERLDQLLPRGTFDLTQDYGGIVAASVVCEFLGIPVDLASEVLASVNAGSLAEPGSGVDTAQVAAQLPGLPDPVGEKAARQHFRRRCCRWWTVCWATGCPTAARSTTSRWPPRCCACSSAAPKPCPRSWRTGLWELLRHPDQLAAVRADPKANVPVAREEMIRYCAPAQWFARTARKPFTIHDTTIEPGQRIITLLASANRDEREYPQPGRIHLEPAHPAARWPSAGASTSVWATTSLVSKLPS